jgi:transcriptional regulator with XRE-family HTH domain
VEKLLRTARPLRGVEVRFLRKFFAMKAADLAKMLNVDPVTVSRWETGTSPVGSANDKLVRFSILAMASARLKDLAEQAHRAATDAYLDMLSEISALKPEETNDEAMSITSEELEHPRLVFKRTLLPTVHVVTD